MRYFDDHITFNWAPFAIIRAHWRSIRVTSRRTTY